MESQTQRHILMFASLDGLMIHYWQNCINKSINQAWLMTHGSTLCKQTLHEYAREYATHDRWKERVINLLYISSMNQWSYKLFRIILLNTEGLPKQTSKVSTVTWVNETSQYMTKPRYHEEIYSTRK